ncbi:1-phosphofructokinase [Halobacteroides halobius DSM 5150]|uniref:Tagatose-6-phosphate kinase n=1 Tax=Halobacteroides halobius (strain ATCC 35273 / DSM 5150 / MD-1) TaxID=748449 RepID=L0KBN9_HALHC|nr:1-phosphofructokinase [Halobacteroides halobius]AGB42421.1 1-phosphofructokinase [Halobacteroides halobius DSM 5150]
MIITVTLNPAVDKTIYVEDFKLGNLNRIKEVRKDPGGKGINVSKVVAKLGSKTVALGFLGGSSGEFVANSLNDSPIRDQFIRLEGETRTNLKMIDTITGQETEINEPGAKVKQKDLRRLENRLLDTVGTDDFVVLTGSLPPGVPQDIYAKLINQVQASGSKVILDTSGQPLVEGLKSKPYLIKPNLEELEVLVGKKLNSLEEVIKAGQKLQQEGVTVVVISLGASGSLVISKQSILHAQPPKVEVASTVGAGDTLVGALAVKLTAGSLKEAIRYATAASANSVAQSGTQVCNKEGVKELLKQVNIIDKSIKIVS